ncbi:MAG: hypothetical protein RMJ15_09770 [Nitrososphaerota archaeon]|nr:hypothetical protein [Candidatus Bathyarchaeota archaeon]MDW8024002.1 hypothetical protein [Nitrososphaerota archaeon]
MPKFRNKVFKNILLDKDGFEITIQQALAKIRRLKKLKAKDPELFELNGGSLDLLQLYQFAEQAKKWNGKKKEVGVLNKAQNKLLSCKIEKVTPETHPCEVLIKALEATQQC